MADQHYDALETRTAAERDAALFASLPAQLEHAKANTAAFGKILADIDTAMVSDREVLATLPVTRKSELMALQAENKPFGGLVATSAGLVKHVYQSPGPIYEPEGDINDYWRTARALFAAGFRAGDMVHNTFSYHFTPAGSMLESGAHALGCTVFPAGVGQTELQVAAMLDLQPNGYVGTPSFLKIILDKAEQLGTPITSLKKALVSGEALPPSLRAEFAERGIAVFQCYATADLGVIAYESESLEGMIVDEGVIVEIVRPGTGEPVAEGEVGEVVVTSFNQHYPLVRFATGDLSAVLARQSPCGRTNLRIKGWMGRADQTTKVKGMFVHPSQVAQVVARHAEVQKARLLVDREGINDVMTLHCEVTAGSDELAAAIASSIRDVCKLRGEAVFVDVGSLANDGKVIDDIRTYE
jgi:phenylacetate-CoA ligase